MIILRSFTGPTHLLSANVQGPVSFAVSARVLVCSAFTRLYHIIAWIDKDRIDYLCFHKFFGLLLIG